MPLSRTSATSSEYRSSRKIMNIRAQPGTRKIIGVMVIYSGAMNLQCRIETAAMALDRVLIVDNSPADHPVLKEMTLAPSDRLRVLENRNKGGLAGAYNRALQWIGSNEPDATHVLFLDEDTDTGTIGQFLPSAEVSGRLSDPSIAAIAPLYIDVSTRLPGAHIQLDRWRFRILPRKPSEALEVTFLINSMSLWKIEALRQIGGHDERLGVDHVDTDYCLRAKALGYKLVLDPGVTFLHTIGSRHRYSFLGISLQAGGHSPERREQIGRNTVILAIRYGVRWPAFALLCLLRLGYEFLGVVLVEENKPRKLCALLAGIAQGFLRTNIRGGREQILDKQKDHL